jgi:hypothetical protein
MPFLPASAVEPHHSRGGAGGVSRAEAIPPWHGQKIKLAKRVWGSGHYSHGAVRYAAQVIALDQRGRHCRAMVATLAGYMGDGKRTAERHLAELAAPGPDGVPEMTVIRHTADGGTGESAERRMRRPGSGEHFAYVPIGAAKALRPILFVLYCALTYAEATNTPVTAAELGALLDVTERSARRLADELQDLGWITINRRTGRQGRHQITVHDHLLHPVPDPVAPHPDGGSGLDPDGGSLAIKEDPGLTDGEKTELGGSFRRRRGTGSYRPEPVDNSSVTTSDLPVVPRSVAAGAAPPAYTGPQLALSPRIWTVLQPVHHLLPGISPYLIRRIAHEIGHQLDTYATPQRLHARLQARCARTPGETITDPGRWLLGAALPRYGCGLTDCETGRLWTTGRRCHVCADIATDRRTAHPPNTAAPGPALHPTGT